MRVPPNFAPPAAPWQSISPDPQAGAYLSVYLSSDFARLPIRDVTRIGDNKSDPNLETTTYGLFSTCEPSMRASISRHDIGEIFFLARVGQAGRALVGMYELGWKVEVAHDDVALAARAMRFIDPIPVGRIRGKAGQSVKKRFRTFSRIDAADASQLRSLVSAASDRTPDYLSEVERLERMSFKRTGYRYPSWDRIDPFDWSAAEPYLSDLSSGAGAPNTSPTGLWICSNCRSTIANKARLKVCNVCRARGTLVPELAAT